MDGFIFRFLTGGLKALRYGLFTALFLLIPGLLLSLIYKDIGIVFGMMLGGFTIIGVITWVLVLFGPHGLKLLELLTFR